jgi:hypothetical protein
VQPPAKGDAMSDLLTALASGPLYRFADWPNTAIPNWRAGVYTVWDGQTLIYVGMAGRGMPVDVHETAAARSTTKPRGLLDRLASHASGRRSGDQFNVYVFDRLVLPDLTRDEISAAAAGELSLDAVTRRYIHRHLGYRYVVTADGKAALALERDVQRGAIAGQRPLLNPRQQPDIQQPQA